MTELLVENKFLIGYVSLEIAVNKHKEAYR